MTSDSLKASASIITMFPTAPDQSGLHTFSGLVFSFTSMWEVILLFENVLKHNTLSSSHPTTHEEENRAPIFVVNRSHHICALRIIHHRCNSDGFHLLHQRREHSCHLQICKEVFLQNSGIPKNDVGEGLLITIDPMSEIEEQPLGEGYCKVFVGKAIKPKVHLEKPRRGVITIGDAVGRHVAWRYCDVIEKYPSG